MGGGEGGSRGTSPSLDLTFPPTGLSENLGGMERGGEGKGRVGRPPALLPPTTFCLKFHPAGYDGLKPKTDFLTGHQSTDR